MRHGSVSTTTNNSILLLFLYMRMCGAYATPQPAPPAQTHENPNKPSYAHARGHHSRPLPPQPRCDDFGENINQHGNHSSP